MRIHTEILRHALDQGPCTARQLAEKAGISQPTVSRALSKLGASIVRIGAGPSIQYAIKDEFRGLVATPIYRVSSAGKIEELGTLVPVRPQGFVMQYVTGKTIYSEGLPWWLVDMRPQGFLGRAYASVYAAGLHLPPNPEHWNDAEVLKALLTHGHDNMGNLLIGSEARDRFLNMPLPVPVNRAEDYPVLAKAAALGEAPGSSAGGEQPKFCAYSVLGHVLVKFTAPTDNPVSERWRDLLLAEHLALEVLGVKTEVYDFGGQRFLEVPRFDRAGQLGRVGICSLRALDMEFVGDALAPWPTLVTKLAAVGLLQSSAVSETARLWAFGCLIGNTDMHAGNLSFIGSEGGTYQLAPAYDMLPMAFAPRSSGSIIDTLAPATLSTAVPNEIWREALQLADAFLRAIQNYDGFSARFLPCIASIRRHIDAAAIQIERLA
ncbi:type II toxin-antitoxin system HipA family toxin YjjJ [Chitinibacter tainanensis]|uniref:type II toxin-antitoxin system HipA family toxin YjjJ n=1 Tax=Chitinibacter tainanensis TaxID=230667 RepID=UPI002357472C|nr:type II toxin-antitoxin system HipA family toxin YjjJ [Chitinibacter tainanensis]